MFVPLLHPLHLTIKVLEDNSTHPVPDTEIAWVRTNPTTGFQWTERIGVTDETGTRSVSIVVQEQPFWAYPPIGQFKFSNLTLQISKQGYEVHAVNLSDVAGAVPYWRKAVSVTLRLQKMTGHARRSKQSSELSTK